MFEIATFAKINMLNFKILVLNCFVFAFLCRISVGSDCSEDENCSGDRISEINHGKDKYKTGNKWDEYLWEIEEAVQSYRPCDGDVCSCYDRVLNSDLSPWKSRGISKQDFNWARSRGVHYQIVNHQLYRSKNCIFPFRCSGVEYFILAVIDDLPDMEMIINTHDVPMSPTYGPPVPVFSFSKVSRDYYDIMYPAWTFREGGPAVWPIYPVGLGRWNEQRKIISKSASDWSWEKKENVAYFRGSRTTPDRDPLVLFSRQFPDLADAQYTKNQAWKSDADTLYRPAALEVKLEDHCKYKYLFNFRGVAASFRFKHLFLCDSLVFQVGNDWEEFFYSAMKPWVHYIPMKQDLSDLSIKLEFARENDDVVRKIAERGRRFIWDHVRMEDVICYWRRLLLDYSQLITFPTQLQDNYHHIQTLPSNNKRDGFS